MEIKRKNIGRNNWKRIIKRKYISEYINEEDIKGIASLIVIKEVKEPLIKQYESNLKVKIVDENFYWLQIAIENENFWITATYDSNKDIVQYYIDITDGNIIEYENKTAFFDDLFLDIVLFNTGEIILLDEEELQQAFKENIISKEQYDLTYEKANEIIKLLKKDKSILENLCDKYFKILLSKVEDK